MKLKEFGPPGGSARPWRPPLDPPMLTREISGVVKFLYVGYTREDTISDLHSGIATADRVNFEQRPGRNKYMKDWKDCLSEQNIYSYIESWTSFKETKFAKYCLT